MTLPDDGTPNRHIPVSYDTQGEPYWRSLTSLSGSSPGICAMVPDRVIPVIFVPGIMGSNLKNKQGGLSWNTETCTSVTGWLSAGAKQRKKVLRPEVMEVDASGDISGDTSHPVSHLRKRGWGEVFFLSYGEFLPWLENHLNDFDHAEGGLRDRLIKQSLGAVKGDEPLTREEVALSYRYRFPVWACGYNWLDDNKASAVRLQKRIEQAIDHYKKKQIKCEKVIIVTHSMGGLVARYCSEVLGESKRMFGIVHGVMPAIGAAAVYRRAKSGTRNSVPFRFSWEGVKAWGKGWGAAKVLGNNAADMTAVLSTSPGALELLPTPEYGNGWLRIKIDSKEIQLPKSNDPYGEIYTARGTWWGLMDEDLMNPLNGAPQGSTAYKKNMDHDWVKYLTLILKTVKPFQQSLKDKYNHTTYAFYANGKDHPAYGNVTWQGRDAWGERWLSGGRPSRPLDAKALDFDQLGTSRTVAAPLTGDGWKTGVNQTYTISDPDAPGDGTVPERSGRAPTRYSQSVLTVDTEHESAFNHEAARHFTASAIVKIAQAVKTTSLAYKS